MKIILLILSLFTLAAFSGKQPEEKSKPMGLIELSMAAKKIASDTSCLKDTDCDAVPMGQKLCGGPAYYQVFSKLKTDSKTIMELSKKHIEMSKIENKKKASSGMVGNCMMVMKPGLSCKSGKCAMGMNKAKGLHF